MKKIFIILLLTAPFVITGCGDIEKREVSETNSSDKKVDIQIGTKESGVSVNLGDNNRSLDVQVGSKEDGVSVKMDEGGLKVNIGDKDGGLSINLGSFLK